MKSCIALSLISLSIVLFSCTKEKDSLKQSISVSVNGTTTRFDHSPSATLYSDASGYHLSISATSEASLLSDGIGIAVVSPTPISTGVFSEFSTTNSCTLVDNVYLSNYNYKPYEALGIASNTDPATVTITSIDASSVKGTFRGTLTIDGLGGSDKLVMTNGVFDIAF